MLGERAQLVFAELVRRIDAGWSVDFGEWGGVRDVQVTRSRLVIGVANGWAQPHPPASKFLLLRPSELRQAWEEEKCAGFMFWTIAEEGALVQDEEFFLASELAQIVYEGRGEEVGNQARRA